MTENSLKTAAAFRGLLDTLSEAVDAYNTPDRGIKDETDIVEGFRYLLHLLSVGTDLYLEGDPERPEFIRIATPTIKFGGDNPDAIYHFARIRGDRSYRITGVRGEECYLSFTIHGRSDDGKLGMSAEPVLADVNDRSFTVAPDGGFEVILSPDEQPGDWIKLDPGAASVIVRQYFETRHSVGLDPDMKSKLRIEPIDAPPERPALSDEVMAGKINDVAAFIRGATIDLPQLFAVPVPFVSPTPNELPQPSGFSSSGQTAWGAMDVAYAMAPYWVRPGEALIIEGKFPDCSFANVVLWNRHMQSLEYRDRRVSLNRVQTVLEPDGSFRMVLAHSDPGVPNWLDIKGHTDGIMFWRYLLPTDAPPKPTCTLVPLSEVKR